MKRIDIKKSIIPYSVILCAVLIFYGRLLFGQMLYTGDIFAYQLPEKFTIREALLSGNIPFMNPYILSGSPMLNNIAVGSLYPLNLLLLIGDPVFGFNLFIFTHLLLAGFAMFIFLSKGLKLRIDVSCLGALSYCLSGPLWGSIDKGFISSAWLIPLFFTGVILLYRNCEIRSNSLYKSPLILPVLSLALLFYCGNFLEAYFAVIIAGVGILLYILLIEPLSKKAGEKNDNTISVKFITKKISKYCLVVIVAILLSAPQIFPTYIASKRSYRCEGIKLEEAQHWSLPPVRVLEFLVPFSFGTRAELGFFFSKNTYTPLNKSKPEGSTPWFDSLFFGLPVFMGTAIAIFAIISGLKNKQFNKPIWISSLLCIGALIFFLLAIGKHFPLYLIFYHILPGFSVFRHPEKFMVWVNIFLIVLGVYGIEKFVIDFGDRGINCLRKTVYGVFAFLVLTGVIIAVYMPFMGAVHQSDGTEVFRWQLTAISSSVFFIGLIAGAVALFKNKQNRMLQALIIITALQSILLSYITDWTIPVSKYKEEEVWTEKLPDFDKSQFRIFTSGTFYYSDRLFPSKDLKDYRGLEYNAPALKKIRTPEGFDAVANQEYVDFFNFKKHSPKKILDLLSVKYIGSGIPANEKTPEGFRKIYPKFKIFNPGRTTQILENPDALPRIAVYKDFKLGIGKNPQFNANFDRKKYFILQNLPTSLLNVEIKKKGDNPKVEIIKDSPGRIDLKVTGGAAWVVVRDWHCPGWECRDESGRKLPIETADGGMMAVFVNANSAKLKLKFIPPGFYPGLISAGMTLLLLVVFLKYENIERKK